MNIKLLGQSSKLPQKATIGASGYDVFAAEDIVIKARSTAVVKLGFALEVPSGHEVQIRPRSGLAAKQRVHAILGTIDSDYRGEVGAILANDSAKPFTVSIGDRIAQMVMIKLPECELNVVDVLSQTERGAGGFGHTGSAAIAPKTPSPAAITQDPIQVMNGFLEKKGTHWVVTVDGVVVASTSKSAPKILTGDIGATLLFAAQQTLNAILK